MPRVAAFLALTLLAGCASQHSPEIDSIIFNADVGRGEGLWRSCIQQTYRERVVTIAGHGTSFNGRWVITPDNNQPPIDVEAVCRTLRAIYGTRPIWVLSCNPGHHRLDVPGVSYATEKIWIVPDKFAITGNTVDETIGKVSEFVRNP